MRESLIYNYRPFTDFETFWDGSQTFITPEKDIEKITILGRNGDLTISNNRYNNVIIPFNCFIRRDFIKNFNELTNFLYSQNGYNRLETSEEPDVYRMASVYEAIEPTTGPWNKSAHFTLEFDCKPQKWLKTGEMPINVEDSITLYNPTYFEAKPLLKVEGIGQIKINSETITLSNNTGVTFIDCESQDAYEGLVNRNGDITTTGEYFPVLRVGENNIKLDSGMKIQVIPRWWRL